MEKTAGPNGVVDLASVHADTRLKRDLLRFWTEHPHAQFTPAIIARAVDRARKTDVEELLESFVQAELIQKRVRHGSSFYCLTAEPSRRRSVFHLVSRTGRPGTCQRVPALDNWN